MTLLEAILKAKSQHGKYSSPPPELEETCRREKVKKIYKYAHVRACVDTSPPRYEPRTKSRNLTLWRRQFDEIYMENLYLLMLIKKAQYMKGRVDSHWKIKPKRIPQYHQNRIDFLKRIRRENLAFYKRLVNTEAKVATTRSLNREWVINRRKIVEGSNGAFVLFRPFPQEDMEDLAFSPLTNIKRTRVYIKLGIKDGAVLGEICVELFNDVCPKTCNLFLDLLDGDTLGHGYVGTCFFRKVPHLYWSGGDVIYNNGFGCYAQRGLIIPIGAENFHFSHSMEGLLSMRVTVDDEMCGLFNITYKPLPQLDLHNVVFGRIIRPCGTYEVIKHLGSALSCRPVVEIRSTRRKRDDRWAYGVPNSKLVKRSSGYLRKTLMMT